MGVQYLAHLGHLIPELLTCATMVALVLMEATYHKGERANEKRGFFYSLCAIGLLLGLIFSLSALNDSTKWIFSLSYVVGPFPSLVKALMILGTSGCLFLASRSQEIPPHAKGEFTILALGILIGGMLLVSANNFLMFFIGIETLSILSYAMAAFNQQSEYSSEAGVKYVLYGALASGMMLFGMAHIFGMTGHIEFQAISQALKSMDPMASLAVLPALFFFFVGPGYKMACVPFHMWSPDVYEGSPTPVTAFFALIPKMAAVAALGQVAVNFFGPNEILNAAWTGAIQIVAALTMTVGNVSAMGQTSLKRLLAYSSIAHGGTLLLGVLVADQMAMAAILFYVMVYLFMTLVAFGVVQAVSDEHGSDHQKGLEGLMFRNPILAGALSVALLSLAGLPPLGGFVAKFNIFSVIISKQYYTLAVIAALNSVVAIYYYTKIIRIMIFKRPTTDQKIPDLSFVNQLILVVMTIPIILLGIFWSGALRVAELAKIFVKS